MTIVSLLALSAILAWLMLITASYVKRRGWTREGLRRLASNRDDEPEPATLGARSERAARNMVENLVLFTALATAVLLAGEEGGQATLGAHLFFWARVVYWPAYVAGVAPLRVTAWAVAVVGMALMATTLL